MKFTRYSSIENSYREKFIDKLIEEDKVKGEWVVTEKMHGSNLSLWAERSEDGNHIVRVAKRSEFIEEHATSKFFRSDLILAEYRDAMIKLLEIHDQANIVSVHGEIFGGVYPHPDVPRNKEVSKVQKGVYYSPDIEFRAFDLKINGSFVDYHCFLANLGLVGIPTVSELFMGTMGRCLEYSNEFQTNVPGELDLPVIENNICEGVVLKPIMPAFLMDGSRVILKNKNDKFKEVSKSTKIRAPKEEIPKEVLELAKIASTYCTENRVCNVVSKIGEVSMRDFGLVMKNSNLDVIEDFMKDHEITYQVLSKSAQKYIMKHIGSCNARVIKAYFRSNV